MREVVVVHVISSAEQGRLCQHVAGQLLLLLLMLSRIAAAACPGWRGRQRL